MRTHACGEHRVPTPEGLFPERLAPGESAILDHTLVATPHVVHQDVDGVAVANDQIERRFHLDVESMVAADARDPFIERVVIRRRTARDEDPRALSSELARDTSSNAFGRSGHDCDPIV